MECGAVRKIRQSAQGVGFVYIGEGHDMRREIAGAIDGGLLGVASSDRADAGFADFRLEWNFAAARLQPLFNFLRRHPACTRTTSRPAGSRSTPITSSSLRRQTIVPPSFTKVDETDMIEPTGLTGVGKRASSRTRLCTSA